MTDIYADVEVYDHENIAAHPYVVTLLQQKNERLFFDCKLTKINRMGMKQERILIISSMAVYNMARKGKRNFVIQRRIPLVSVEAITISDPDLKSDEVLLHVKNEYDYRYNAPEDIKE